MTLIHPLIDGGDCPGEETFVVHSPADGRELARVSIPSPADLARALEAAGRDFAHLRKRKGRERRKLLETIQALLSVRREEAARIIVDEAGKPLRLARLEVERALTTLALAAEESTRQGGEILKLDCASEERQALLARYPVGPVLGITPFNFPLNLVMHKFAPALACGCPFLLKPASATPLTGRLLCELALEAGALPGEVQFLPLPGAQMQSLVRDPRLRKISFTGSAGVGWSIAGDAPRSRVTLELGGNAAVIVEDTVNPTSVAQRICQAAFSFSGQVCISVQRILVRQPLLDEFRGELVRSAEALLVGDPQDERTEIGPLIDRREADRVMDWIESALASGAKLLCGGRREGNVIWPTLLEHVPVDHPLQCEEAFGPVACLDSYLQFDEALQRANESRFGLQAGVFTHNLDQAFQAWNELETGGVIINDTPAFRADAMPYGGVKDSGRGREGIRYAMESMTEPRLLVLGSGR